MEDIAPRRHWRPFNFSQQVQLRRPSRAAALAPRFRGVKEFVQDFTTSIGRLGLAGVPSSKGYIIWCIHRLTRYL